MFDLLVTENGTAVTYLPHDVRSGAAKQNAVSFLGRQFRALFNKRFHYVRRSLKAFFSQVSSIIQFIRGFSIANVGILT